MEFEEQKEIVNPQNGEKIAVKKEKFWRSWRFWLLAAIAVMLFMMSVSSAVTACAAVNAGVGKEESTSEVVRSRKGAYYDPEQVGDYDTAVGWIENYSVPLRWQDGTQSHYGYVDAGGYIQVYHYVSFQCRYEWQSQVHLVIYEDGYFYADRYVTYGEWCEQVEFDASSYYWIFESNAYDEGFADGSYSSSAFYSFTINYNVLGSGSNLFRFVPDVTTTGTMYETAWWDLFTYRYEDAVRMVSLFGSHFTYSGTDDSWLINLVDWSGDGVRPTMQAAESESLGYVRYPSSSSSELIRNVSLKVLNFSGGASVVSIKRAYLFKAFVYLDNGDAVADAREEGYTEGYNEAKDYWYNIGKVDGANSVTPDSLTDTLVTVFQQPFNQIYRFFNFNVLGLNILALGTGLIGIFIIIRIVKKVV